MQSSMINYKYGQAVNPNNVYSEDKWSVVIILLIFGQVAPVIFQKYGQVVLLCDRQSTLRYMIRCSKQSAITKTSLGQVVQFLKSKTAYSTTLDSPL